MQRMYSPWRSKYVASFSEQSSGECILCKAFQENDDDKNLIVTRGIHCYVIMNLYPYNSGHLMVVPFRHIGNLDSFSNEESLEIFDLLKRMTASLTEIMTPDSFNIGSNVGRSAGAGIDDHIHFHIVPRWNGDTNFMPVLADTKLISEDMNETLLRLRKTIR
ncbi:MAG: HIT domain-containing protein [Bacteroidota bacterium]|nr:HIT domain-containing protein [Bacteroidota bacterium]